MNQLAFLAVCTAAACIAAGAYELCTAALESTTWNQRLRAALATEFLGTYLSVLLIVATSDEGRETSAQAVGLGYAALTYFGARQSGAHYNPIISLAHWISQGLFVQESPSPFVASPLLYMALQFVATLSACFTTFLVHEGLPSQHMSFEDLTTTPGLNTLLCAFLVCLVHLSVIGDPSVKQQCH